MIDNLTAVLEADVCDQLFSQLERSPALAEVAAERDRQDRKWGEQNHPLTEPIYAGDVVRRAREYEVPSATRARFLCELAADRGELTWAHILVEELAEFIDADSPADARAELVQVAAVAVAAIESIDRHAARSQRG